MDNNSKLQKINHNPQKGGIDQVQQKDSHMRYTFKNINQSQSSYDNSSLQQQYQSPHFNPNEFQTDSSNSFLNIQSQSVYSERFQSNQHGINTLQNRNAAHNQINNVETFQHPNNTKTQNPSYHQYNNQTSQINAKNNANTLQKPQQTHQQQLFKSGVEFDQIFQKDYFEDVLKYPDSSISDISSRKSSPSPPFKRYRQTNNSKQFSINQSINQSSPQKNSIHEPIRQSEQNCNQRNSRAYNMNILSSQRQSDQKRNSNNNSPITNFANSKSQMSQNINTNKQQVEQDDDLIMESMSQLLKAVNQLKITKDENNSIHDNQRSNYQNEQRISVLESDNNQLLTDSYNANPFAKYLHNALQSVDNIQNKQQQENNLHKTRNNNNFQNQQQTQSIQNIQGRNNNLFDNKSQDIKPGTPNNNQLSKSQSSINFQFKTQLSQNNLQTSISPNKSMQKQYQNKSKSPITKSQYLNPLKKSPSNFSNKYNISKLKSSKSRSPTSANKSQISQNELAQDVINRLFMNHKRTQEQNDKKRYVQLQRELNLMQDKPQISDNSQKIMMKSARYHQPIYSPQRYQQELDHIKLKKEQNLQLKLLRDRERELQEEEEMLIHQQKYIGKKIDMEQFSRKYENNFKKWEARMNNKLDESSIIEQNEKSPSFKPQINIKSKELAKHILKIEQRVNILQENKKNKLQKLELTLQPSFTPQINKNTDKYLNKNQNDNSYLSSSRSPIIKNESKLNLSNNKQFETIKQKIRSDLSPVIVNNKSQSKNNSKSPQINLKNQNSPIQVKENVYQVKKKQDNKVQSKSPQKVLATRSPNKIALNHIQTNNNISLENQQQQQYQQPRQIVSTLQSQEWPINTLNQDNRQSIQNNNKNQQQQLQQSPIIKEMRVSEISQNNNHLNETKNLVQVMGNINQANNVNNDLQQIINDQHYDILQEYIKLKDEFNISLSNRNSNIPLRQSELKFDKNTQQLSPNAQLIQQTQNKQINLSQLSQDFKVIKSQKQSSIVNCQFSPDRLDKSATQKYNQNSQYCKRIGGTSPSQYSTIQDNLQVREFDAMLSSSDASNNQIDSVRRSKGIEPYKSQSPKKQYNSQSNQILQSNGK